MLHGKGKDAIKDELKAHPYLSLIHILMFKEKLEALGLEVVLWDERLTTVAAEKILISADVSRKKRKKIIDQMAAVQILQSYLDSKH